MDEKLYCKNCGQLIVDEDKMVTMEVGDEELYYCCVECMEVDYFGENPNDEDDYWDDDEDDEDWDY